MSIISRFNPLPGLKDLWGEFTRPQPYRWLILCVSMLGTFCLLFGFTQIHYIIPPREPEVTYITTFAPDRTDEEIAASNIEHQKLKEARQAQEAELEEMRKEIYRSIGRASGLDVDEMERKIAEDEAQEKAREESQKAEKEAKSKTGTVQQQTGQMVEDTGDQ